MRMMKYNYNKILFVLLVIVYTILLYISFDFCYFWDNIQQVSKEAHFFFNSNFSIFPTNKLFPEYSLTGYHPPLIGFITALLWKLFGCKLWVSHVFIYIWALLLIYNTKKLVSIFFNEKHIGLVSCILLLEPTILSQFVIASPDIVLFAAFVISLRAILEQKHLLLSIGLFFLFGISMRGVFVGVILLISHLIYIYKKTDSKLYLKNFSAYIPTLLLLSIYYLIYFQRNGWFFTNSSYAEHYQNPTSLIQVLIHLAEFGIRSIENGRFLIWILGMYILFFSFPKFRDNKFHLVTSVFTGIFLLYFLFIFITQMPFSSRYFITSYFLLTIIILIFAFEKLKKKLLAVLLSIIIFLEISGNFWIYPEKIAKSWDTTLAHIPYYSLRKECFEYIDRKRMDYNNISAGFCLYGNRKDIELIELNKTVSNKMNKKYYIYSNISNAEDSIIDELNDKRKWIEIKRFNKTPVFISIYSRIQ